MTVPSAHASARRSDRAKRFAVPVVLTSIALAMVVLAGIIRLGADEDRDAAALAAARQGAMNFFSLDYRTAATDVERVLSLATGNFRREYAARKEEIVRSTKRKKLVVTALVPDDGVALEYLSATKAQVLVSVDVTTTEPEGRSATKTGRAESDSRYRTRVLLEFIDDRWLVADLDQVG